MSPISLVVAIQSTGISIPALTKIRRIGGMIQPLVIGSRGAAVMTFDDEVTWLQEFTPDSGKLQAAITNLTTRSTMRARMLDAVIDAAGHLKGREGRKVLLLISESRDRGSNFEFQKAVGVGASGYRGLRGALLRVFDRICL